MLIQHFVGMGFPDKLVVKAIEEIGIYISLHLSIKFILLSFASDIDLINVQEKAVLRGKY